MLFLFVIIGQLLLASEMVVHGGHYGGYSFEQPSIEHADTDQIDNDNDTSSEESVFNGPTTSTFGSSSLPALVRRVDRSADDDDSSEHLRSDNITRQTGKETVEDSLEDVDVSPKHRVVKTNRQNDQRASPEQDD